MNNIEPPTEPLRSRRNGLYFKFLKNEIGTESSGFVSYSKNKSTSFVSKISFMSLTFALNKS